MQEIEVIGAGRPASAAGMSGVGSDGLLGAAGRVLRIAVIGPGRGWEVLGGPISAPALYASFLEMMAQALAVRRGYDPDLCRTLVRQTASGTLALQDQEGVSTAEMIRRVAHPGGSTEAGLTVLRAQLPSLIEEMLRNMKKW